MEKRSEPTRADFQETIILFSSQLYIHLHQSGRLNGLWWEYLCHRNWKTPQIGAYFFKGASSQTQL